MDSPTDLKGLSETLRPRQGILRELPHSVSDELETWGGSHGSRGEMGFPGRMLTFALALK